MPATPPVTQFVLLLNDISEAPELLVDIAVKSGATSINRLTFTVRNEDSARCTSSRGSSPPGSSGSLWRSPAHCSLRIVRLLTVHEGQPVIVTPLREISFEKLQSTNLAPISPGTIDVHAEWI